MILAILFAYLGYKKAQETGRSKALWTVLMVLIFLGAQLLAGLILGLILATGVGLWGWSENAFDTYYWPMNVIGVVFSVAICSLVLYVLGKKPVIEPIDSAPPPPPTFETD